MKEVLVSSDTLVDAAAEALVVLMLDYHQSPEQAGGYLGVVFSCIGKLHTERHPEFDHHELRDAIIDRVREVFGKGGL